MYYLYSVPEQKIVKPAGCESVWKSPKRERQIQILIGERVCEILK